MKFRIFYQAPRHQTLTQPMKPGTCEPLFPDYDSPEAAAQAVRDLAELAGDYIILPFVPFPS